MLWAFLPRFNARFGVPAAEPGSAYRPLPPDLDLAHVFCFRYQRVVANDNSVRLGPHRLQLLPGPDRRSYARVQVEVHERLDGSLAVYHRGRCLATQAAPAEAPVLRIRGGRPGAYAATGPAEPAPPPAAPPRRPGEVRPAADPPLEAEVLQGAAAVPPHLAMSTRTDKVAGHHGGQSPWSATPGRQGGGPPAAAPEATVGPFCGVGTLPENS